MPSTKFSLCWECKKAVGLCPWSAKLKPIPGWEADKFGATAQKPYSTYLVKQCPLFERDAYDGGMRRQPREIKV